MQDQQSHQDAANSAKSKVRLSRAEQIEQLRAKAQRLEDAENEKIRKRETRQKIVIGSAVLVEARQNPAFKEQLLQVLKRVVTRPVDAEVISEWLSST